MLGFLFKRSKKTPSNLSQKSQPARSSQSQLDRFQAVAQSKQPFPRSTSFRLVEDEVLTELKTFEAYVKGMKETSLKMEELAKMLRSGDISESAYRLVVDELGKELSVAVEEIFRLREVLELAKAKAKLEWAKEKIGLREYETPEVRELSKADYYWRQEVYSPLYRWEELISKIDAALSSLTMEEEIFTLEQYLSLVKERLSPDVSSPELERGKAVCQQRLDSISEKWATIRRAKIEEVMNHELKASQLRDETKEVEVRFNVGEFNQAIYELKMSALQGSLKNVEREISSVRSYIDDIDMKIFRCSELLRESA